MVVRLGTKMIILMKSRIKKSMVVTINDVATYSLPENVLSGSIPFCVLKELAT